MMAARKFYRQSNSNLGFKRDDPSTIHEDHLPVISEKGMIFGYGESQRSRQLQIPTNTSQALLTSLGLGAFARSPVSLALSRRFTALRTLSSASTASTSLSPTAKISSPTSHGLTKTKIPQRRASAVFKVLSTSSPTVPRMVDSSSARAHTSFPRSSTRSSSTSPRSGPGQKSGTASPRPA